MTDLELLVGLTQTDLLDLSRARLAQATEARLKELLSFDANEELTGKESAELDHLLEQVEQLTILKTRARYTLKQLGF